MGRSTEPETKHYLSTISILGIGKHIQEFKTNKLRYKNFRQPGQENRQQIKTGQS